MTSSSTIPIEIYESTDVLMRSLTGANVHYINKSTTFMGCFGFTHLRSCLDVAARQ